MHRDAAGVCLTRDGSLGTNIWTRLITDATSLQYYDHHQTPVVGCDPSPFLSSRLDPIPPHILSFAARNLTRISLVRLPVSIHHSSRIGQVWVCRRGGGHAPRGHIQEKEGKGGPVGHGNGKHNSAPLWWNGAWGMVAWSMGHGGKEDPRLSTTTVVQLIAQGDSNRIASHKVDEIPVGGKGWRRHGGGYGYFNDPSSVVSSLL